PVSDDTCHIAIVEQLRVALSVECADMGHEILAPAAAVNTMATRAVALVHRFAALRVTRRRPGGHEEAAKAGTEQQRAPAAPLAEVPLSSLLAASPGAEPEPPGRLGSPGA